MTTEYEDKSELDFNRRLVAQFEIPAGAAFWGGGLSRIGDGELFPPEDSIRELCASIDVGTGMGPEPELLGTFVASWTALEQLVVAHAQRQEQRMLTLGQALRGLRKHGRISENVYAELDQLRQFRNRAVHGQDTPSDQRLRDATERVEQLRRTLRTEHT